MKGNDHDSSVILFVYFCDVPITAERATNRSRVWKIIESGHFLHYEKYESPIAKTCVSLLFTLVFCQSIYYMKAQSMSNKRHVILQKSYKYEVRFSCLKNTTV